ncbi:hypothetical protein HDU91_002362 [Kappamyces sp. JEL0680]|nr:hypothetical protein HDU91_002362 [Kappamyces sp. JEL0680]
MSGQSSPSFDFDAAIQHAHQTKFTLAFVNADKKGNLVVGASQSLDTLAPIAKKLRDAGGDAIVSLGGYEANRNGGSLVDIASYYKDDMTKLVAAYQSIVDTTKATWIDYDVEGWDNVSDQATNEVRAKALVQLKTKNPSLQISLTLPVGYQNGFFDNAYSLVKKCKEVGFKPDLINLMAMDFDNPPDGATKMGYYAIQVATLVQKQLNDIDFFPPQGLGITTMIGKQDNGFAPQVFTQKDAQKVIDFAIANPKMIGRLAFWSANRDTSFNSSTQSDLPHSSLVNQVQWEFTNIFQRFDPPTLPPTASSSVRKRH